MKRPAANHRRGNTPPRRWRIAKLRRAQCTVRWQPAVSRSACPGAGAARLCAVRAGRPGAGEPGSDVRVGVHGTGRRGPAARCLHVTSPRGPGGYLNWSLRRYVRPSWLRVWLLRQMRETGGAADRGGPLRAGGQRPRAVGASRLTAPSERAAGGSRPAVPAARKPLHRNGQMEHSTQVVAGLRGGVRWSGAIAPRESAHLRDQVLTTLGSKTNVQSNIFGFVMT
jgi:hypothetical protein